MTMSATAIEILDGAEGSTGDNASATLRFYVTAVDEFEALNAAGIPTAYDGMPRQSRSWQQIGAQQFIVTAKYGMNEGTADGEDPADPTTSPQPSYEFNTSGGSETMFVSLQNKQMLAVPGATAPDFKGGINVTDDGPQGVERTVPVFSFSETHYKAAGYVTNSYISTLQSLTGAVNSDSFRGFAAGEVLFLGCRGSKQGAGGLWELSYSFAVSPNVANATIGEFTGVNKKGWEYLWFLFEDTEDTTAKKVVRRPRAAYVEQIYKTAAFSGLGI